MSRKSNSRKGKNTASGERKRRRRGNNVLWYLLICVFMITLAVVLTTRVFFNIKTITVKGFVDKYDGYQIKVLSVDDLIIE
jgi:predicted nucleic acid-binding Zn ribbon protein